MTVRACSARSAITGIPSGRRFPLAFGMIHPLDRPGPPRGRCPAAPRRPGRPCPRPSSTTRPSTPAVLRPALSSVTRRTLSSAFARERSINFCRLRTRLQVPCLRRREDPLPQPPYVVLDPPPVDGLPVQDIVLRSVHHHVSAAVSNLPLGSGVSRHRVVTGSPDPRQLPFGPGQTPVSGQLSGRPSGGGAGPAIPGFLLPFGRRRSLLGSSCARWGIGAFLTVGLPAHRHRCAGPQRGCHVAHVKTRPGRAPP